VPTFSFNPLLWPLAFAICISLAMAAFTVRRRRVHGANAFLILLLGLCIWTTSYAAELAADDEQTKLAFYYAGYLGIVLLPGSWLLFAMAYAGRSGWLVGGRRLVLLIEPLLLLCSAATNDVFGFLVHLASPAIDSNGALLLTFGPAYWIGTAYSFAVVALGTSLLALGLDRSKHLYSKQAAALVVASSAPLAANLMYFLGVTGGLDLTPFSFSVSSTAFFLGFLRYRFLDVVPIARGAVIETMRDGVLVVDRFGRLLDINPTAAALLGVNAGKAAGRALTSLDTPLAAGLGRLFATGRDTAELFQLEASPPRWLDLRVSTMQREVAVVGRVVLIHDVTARVLAQQTVLASEQRLRLALEAARMATWEWDGTTQTLSWSNEAHALLGLTRAEEAPDVMGTFSRLHPEDRRSVEQAFAAGLQTGSTVAIEARIQRYDGVQRWIDIRGKPLTGTQGPERLIGTIMDVTERREATEALAHQARHDRLTDLPNRRRLQERLEAALLDLRDRGQPLALLLLDLDRFKEVNDTLGHEVGDLVLREVADRLRAARTGDVTIARLGGDEFAAVLPGADAASAVEHASTLRSLLGEPVRVGEHCLDIGASIGVALAPQHGAEASELLRCSDIAMYAAKRSGRGVAVFGEGDEVSPTPAEQKAQARRRPGVGGGGRRARHDSAVRSALNDPSKTRRRAA
jgi:diguanylate cyclase (GGDEF)-like protein/PAS domain S-box-containing protein